MVSKVQKKKIKLKCHQHQHALKGHFKKGEMSECCTLGENQYIQYIQYIQLCVISIAVKMYTLFTGNSTQR